MIQLGILTLGLIFVAFGLINPYEITRYLSGACIVIGFVLACRTFLKLFFNQSKPIVQNEHKVKQLLSNFIEGIVYAFKP